MRLLVPSNRTLLRPERNQRRMPPQWPLIVWVTLMMGTIRLCVAQEYQRFKLEVLVGVEEEAHTDP